MENLETPKRCGWSIIRKAQVVTALIGAFVTTAILVINYCRLLPPSAVNASWFPAFNFLFGIVMRTADTVVKLLGVSATASLFLLVSLAIISNTLLCFIAGTFIGWLIQKLKTKS